jgi:hypothetical protein
MPARVICAPSIDSTGGEPPAREGSVIARYVANSIRQRNALPARRRLLDLAKLSPVAPPWLGAELQPSHAPAFGTDP